jgi:putative lipoic acid-binding regulatory protein
MTESNETLFKFPCDYPLKVMGKHTDEFRSLVLGIVQRHAGEETSVQVAERPSKDGNYLALTCTFTAQSRAQLDALYTELTSCELVRFAL